MDLDNLQRRLSSQEVEAKNKLLALVKENTSLSDAKKKTELLLSQLQKKYSELELLNRTYAVKLKDAEKKINSIYRANTTPTTNANKKKNKEKEKKEKKTPKEKEKEPQQGDSMSKHKRVQLTTGDSFSPLPSVRSHDGDEQVLEHPPESADILLIGKDKLVEKIVSYLHQKKHKAITVDLEECVDLLLKKKFQCVLCDSKLLPELLSNGPNFIDVLKKKNNGVPFMSNLSFESLITAYTLNEGIDGILKQLNSTSTTATHLQELIKMQITVFLQNLWCNEFSHEQTEHFEKEKKVLQMASKSEEISKLEEEIRNIEKEKKKLSHRLSELNSIVQKLVEEKEHFEAENDGLKKKVSALCSKIFLLELDKENPSAASALEGHMTSETKLIQDKTVSSVVGAFESPVQTLTRLIVLLLKDDRTTHEIRPHLEGVLNNLSSMNAYSPKFDELFSETGLDALTQSWMLYEFAKGKIINRSAGDVKHGNSHNALPEPSKLAEVRDKSVVESWGCDAHGYQYEELITLYIHMLEKLGVIEYFNIPQDMLINFCRTICRSYRRNPYHNFCHAFDVSQMCFKLIYKTKAMDVLTEIDVLSLMIAAICHDVDHPGLNNNFQINDSSHLALLYNDFSVLEMHHASRSFYILNSPENNIYTNMEESQYRESRKIIVSAILATDMSNHFELMSRFTTQLSTQPFTSKNPEARQLLVNVILHVADISNVSRPWDLAKRWSDEVLQEFLHQGDLEKEKELLISPYMDRNNTDQPKMSLGFIDYMVAPMLTSLKKVLPEAIECVETLQKNRARWAELAEEVSVEKVMEDYKKEKSGNSEERTVKYKSDSEDGMSPNTSTRSLPEMEENSSPPKRTILSGDSGGSGKGAHLKHAKSQIDFEPQPLRLKKKEQKKKSNLPQIK